MPAVLALPLALAAAGACTGEGAPEQRSLYELERMAFLAPGPCVLEGYSGDLADCSLAEPLLIDLYEVTRGDWAHYFGRAGAADPGGAAAPEPEQAWSDGRATWPATVDLGEARELARRRGMRLPTGREWIYCAVGPRAHPYPWGTSPQQSIANTLELGLGRPTPVGTFESGRAPAGCYDLCGNVWEWVADWVPGLDEGLAHVTVATEHRLVSVMGGSYRYLLRQTYGPGAGARAASPVFCALSVDPTTRSDDIGMRCAVDAAAYLRAHAERWTDAPEAEARLVAVGRRWGPDALPTLARLRREPGAPESLSWLWRGAER